MSGRPVTADKQTHGQCVPGRTEFRRQSERRAVLRGQFARTLPENVAHRENSALALHWLDDDRANIAVEFRFKVGDIVEAHKIHSGHQRLERFTVFQRVRDGESANVRP